MFKKGISKYEFSIIMMITLLATYITNEIANNTIFDLLVIVYFIFIVYFILDITIMKVKKRYLPKGSIYNVLGYIEIHVDLKCKHSRIKFKELCSSIILYAHDKKKKVMFDTNLIKRETLQRIFKDAITIYEPSIFQRIMNLTFKVIFKNKRKRDYFRGIIDTSKLTIVQIKLLGLYKSTENK